MSLRARLNLTLVMTLFATLAMATLFAVHHGRRAVEIEMRSSVELALRLLDTGIAEPWTSEEALGRWLLPLTQSHGMRHLRIRISRNEQPVLAIHTPSSSQIVVPGWFARWVTPEPQSIERVFPLPNGLPMRVVIQPDPHDEIMEVWEESLGFLRLLGMLAMAICVIIHVMLGRAFRSVNVILRGLKGIESGNYGARLPPFDLPEFAQLAQTFNHMAAALGKARQENRMLTQHSLAIQEEERRYIAQELHDELGQSLSAIKVLAVSVRALVSHPEGREALTTVIRQCDQLFGVVRALMRRLRPVMLDELGLTASLENLIEQWKTRHPNIRVTFHCEPAVEARAGAVKIHLFRIVQECLTNVSRHADATEVLIRLTAEATNHAIRLVFSDNGKGFDTATPSSGFGLFGIRERTLSLGGEFSLETHPGQGVHLTITIPCECEETDENDSNPIGR